MLPFSVAMVQTFKAFFQRHIQEIAADPALRWYGACLALTHVLTFNMWRSMAPARLTTGEIPYCWPFFTECYRSRPWSPTLVQGILAVYLIVGLIGLGLFLFGRIRPAYWCLTALSLGKFALFAQDYRFMGNYHYMIFIVSAAYLWAPCKRACSELLMIGFYLAAGALKFNYEWLSATSMLPRTYLAPLIPRQLLELSCAYVVLLEMVFSWLLLAKNRLVFWLVFCQFLIFHLFSWHIVTYFYPCVMFCLLPIFVLRRWYPMPTDSNLASDFFRLRMPRPVYAVMAIFIIFQLIPRLNRGDASLTAEGRMFAMDMFDSRAECETELILRKPGSVIKQSPDFTRLGIILRCDPLIYFNIARSICRGLAEVGATDAKVDVMMNSKRTSSNRFQPVVAIHDFCAQKLGYSIFGWNDWIQR